MTSIIRARKSKTSIVYGTLKQVSSIEIKHKASKECDRELFDFIKMFYTEGEVSEVIEDYRGILEFRTDWFSEYWFAQTEIKLVRGSGVKKALKEQLSTEGAYALGGYCLDTIKEALILLNYNPRTRHTITSEEVDTILENNGHDRDNEALGRLLRSTVGFLDAFIETMLNKWGAKQVVQDTLMYGEQTYTVKLKGENVFVSKV